MISSLLISAFIFGVPVDDEPVRGIPIWNISIVAKVEGMIETHDQKKQQLFIMSRKSSIGEIKNGALALSASDSNERLLSMKWTKDIPGYKESFEYCLCWVEVPKDGVIHFRFGVITDEWRREYKFFYRMNFY